MKRIINFPKTKRPKAKPARISAAEKRRSEKDAAREAIIARLDPARPIPEMLIWYALISKPFKEHTLAIELETRTEAFSLISLRDTKPRRKATVRRPKSIPSPVLPGVVFAGFKSPPNWLKIEDCKGYQSRIEYLDGCPAVMKAVEIAAWRDKNQLARLQANIKKVAGPGATVKTRYGTTDKIVRLEGPYAVLATMMLGQHVKVKLSETELLEVA